MATEYKTISFKADKETQDMLNYAHKWIVGGDNMSDTIREIISTHNRLFNHPCEVCDGEMGMSLPMMTPCFICRMKEGW